MRYEKVEDVKMSYKTRQVVPHSQMLQSSDRRNLVVKEDAVFGKDIHSKE